MRISVAATALCQSHLFPVRAPFPGPHFLLLPFCITSSPLLRFSEPAATEPTVLHHHAVQRDIATGAGTRLHRLVWPCPARLLALFCTRRRRRLNAFFTSFAYRCASEPLSLSGPYLLVPPSLIAPLLALPVTPRHSTLVAIQRTQRSFSIRKPSRLCDLLNPRSSVVHAAGSPGSTICDLPLEPSRFRPVPLAAGRDRRLLPSFHPATPLSLAPPVRRQPWKQSPS